MMISVALVLAMGCGKKEVKQTAKEPPPIKPGTVIWEFETGDDVFSSPAIGSDGTVYVGSVDKKLYAINGKTGGKIGNLKREVLYPPLPPLELMARFTSGQGTKSSMPSMARAGSSYGNL